MEMNMVRPVLALQYRKNKDMDMCITKEQLVPRISFIIPCYRSENTIECVINEIIDVVAKIGGTDYEIIAINDDSPDGTLRILKERAADDQKLKVISFSKNFGQHAGMMAGVNVAVGDYVVFLDDDGQCPLDKLPLLLKPLGEGWDIAIAQYGKKTQSWFKNMCSITNEMVANLLIDKPRDIQMGNFMAIRRPIAEELKKYTGPYPYISGLLFRASNKVINIPMKERPRMAGKTTYTLKKLFLLWLNSFIPFSIKPLRVATALGGVCSLVGFLYGVYTIIYKIINPAVPAGYSSLMAAFLLISGLIMMVLGVIGEYVGRIYISINNSPQYVIRETVNCKEDRQ